MDGHLCCLHILAVVNSAFVNIEVQVSFCFFFFFFLKKRVEFNIYLQDNARYEIPHRNKKPIERRSFIQYVQFGTVQV